MVTIAHGNQECCLLSILQASFEGRHVVALKRYLGGELIPELDCTWVRCKVSGNALFMNVILGSGMKCLADPTGGGGVMVKRR